MPLIKLLFLFLFSMLASCQRNEKTNLTIKVGVPKNVSFALFWIAKEKLFFEKQKINVEIFSDGDLTKLYQNGKVDLICSNLTEPILIHSEGINTQIIYRFSYTSGNDIVIARPEFKKLSDLKGKIISFDRVNSSSHIFIEEVLDKNGVKEGEYLTKNLSLQNMVTEFQNGKIQAGHTNIRYLHELDPKSFSVIARSSDLPDLVTDVMSGRTKFLFKHKTDIKRLINALLLAKEYYETHREESIEILSKTFGEKNELISEELNSLRFLSREENFQSLGTVKKEHEETNPIKTHSFHMNQEKKGALFLAAETMIQFLRTRGQLYKNPNLNQLIVNEYLKEIDSP